MNDGSSIIEPERGHEGETLRLLQRAIRNGWDIPQVIVDAAPKVAGKIMTESKDNRDRLRAIEVLATMARDNVNALEKLNKVERLEAGESTENIAFPRMTFGPPNRGGT